MSKETVAAINKKLHALFDKGILAPPKIVIVIKDSKQVEKTKESAAYVQYEIECKNGTTEWKIQKKYEDFSNLSTLLKKELKVMDVPPLPRRTASLFGAKVPKDQKKLRLQEFVVYLANTRVVKFKAVQEFLEAPKELRETVDAIWKTIETPLYTGWVEKLGGTYKTWRKRYCQCSADYTIKYYEDDKMETLKGTVDLREVEQSRQDHSDTVHMFILELRTKTRVWKFNCESQKELDKFFDTIQLLREDENGWKEWLPENGGKMRSFTVVGGPADDEKKTDEMGVIEEEEEVDEELLRLRDQNKEARSEITNLESNLSSAVDITEDLKSLLKKTQQNIDDMKKSRARAEEEVKKMKKSSVELKSASENKVKELQAQTDQVMALIKTFHKENKNFEALLTKLQLKAVPTEVDENLNNFILDKPVISGPLLKFGKGGRKKPKPKHAVFVAVKEGFFIEWADALKENQGVSRMKLLGWSLDPNLIDTKRLTNDELDRVFIVQGIDRLAIFMADTKDSRDRWINGFQRAKLTQLQSKEE